MGKPLRKRPVGNTIFGVIWFIISAGQIIGISAPSIRNVASWYPIAYGSIIALRFISIVGLWHMKKWGFELFIYISLVKIMVQVIMGNFGGFAIFDTFLLILTVIISATYYKRMTRDL